MRCLAALLAVLVLVSCGSPPPLITPSPVGDLVIPTTVPNGTVEVIVKRGYTVGETVRATVRLRPTSGRLRGPLDPFIQASGFHGTATVRHLAVDPVNTNAGAAEMVVVVWDMRDDAGTVVGGDDYSLVFNVIDDSGRTTTVGATLQVR
ncbi:MAG: hypothetical protein ACRDG6_06075 [Candidatus Limnocylindria bacterium]